MTAELRLGADLMLEAYEVGLDSFRDVTQNNKPARLQEQALVGYFVARSGREWR